MEVTKDNFHELLPEIEAVIKEASFLAVDSEFTGLNDGPRANPFDTPAQYFEKVRNGCSEFLLIQFGLCAFKYNDKTKRFTHRAYNFYIFPNPINRNVPDFRFRCQSSSLNFLATQNFDFNKLFKSGIPFLTQDAEQLLLKDIDERQKNLLNQSFTKVSEPQISVPEEFKETIEAACKKLEDLIENGKTGDSIQIDEPNGFVRKLIYQAAEKKFPEEPIGIETKKLESRKFTLIATKGTSKEEMEKVKKEKDLQGRKNQVKETVGFSALIRLISGSGKLVVGHNMLMDIFYTVNQFCTPVLNSYEEFKEVVHFTFPKIMDTKLMCALSPLKEVVKSSVLSHVLETIKTEPFKVQEVEAEKKESGYSLKDVKEHEAGYDAFMTGVIFLALFDYLNTHKKINSVDYSSKGITTSPVLRGLINKVFLMRRYDAPYLNFAGKDPEPSRSNVFHTTFPKEWSTKDIVDLFSDYSDVDIVWCSDTSAWASLVNRHPDVVKKVVKNLVNNNDGKLYKVRTFAQYQEYINELHPNNVHGGANETSPYVLSRKRKIQDENSTSPAAKPSTTSKLKKTNSCSDVSMSKNETEKKESSDADLDGSSEDPSKEPIVESSSSSSSEDDEEEGIIGQSKKLSNKKEVELPKADSGTPDNTKKVFEENDSWE